MSTTFFRADTLIDIEDNKQLAKELVDAMNRSDTQWFLDNYADDVVVWTMGNTLISGKYSKDQVAGFADSIFEAFPNGIKFTNHSMVAEGDTVAVETESIGELKEYLDTELVTDVIAGGQRPELQK